MSVSPHTRKRLPTIIEGLFNGKTYDEIAKDCGVTRRTIERDIASWRASGGFEDELQNEWFQVHAKVKQENLIEVYRRLTYLLGRTMTQKIKAEVEHGAITIKMWQPKKEEKKENADSTK